MKSFINYINQSSAEDAEYEGLVDQLNHLYHSNTIDPKLEKHILSGNDINLHEAEMSAHAKVKEKMQNSPMTTVGEKVKKALKEALIRHKEVYGTEIGKALSEADRHKTSNEAIRDHYSKPLHEQKKALKEAADRLGYVAYGRRGMSPSSVAAQLSGGNKKTDTVVNNPLVKHKGRLTSSVSSYGGAPAAYTHFASADMTDRQHTVTCPHGSTGCMYGSKSEDSTSLKKALDVGPACLAMAGGYNFLTSQTKTQVNSHIRSGEHTIRDHAILAAHHFVNKATRGAQTNTIHSIRGQTTDQRGSDIRAIANETAKHNPVVKEHSLLFGYTKNFNEAIEAARKTKAGIGVPEHIVFSHPGPAYHEDESGKLHLNHETIRTLKKLREAHKTVDKEGLVVNDYVVAGGKPIDKEGNVKSNSIHRQPKQNAKAEDVSNFHGLDASVKSVRHWDLHHSGTLKAGEAESHHDEKTGSGYLAVEQEGKKVKVGYHDRKSNVGDTDNGHIHYTERHDGRYSDAEQKKPTSLVTAPVASSSNMVSRGAYANSLQHQIHVSFDTTGNKFRQSKAGVLHDAHPDLMKKAGYTYSQPGLESKTV